MLLIDAKALYSDELYCVGNSFKPIFGSFLAMLRLLLAICCGAGFPELNAGVEGVREQDQFHLISYRTSGL